MNARAPCRRPPSISGWRRSVVALMLLLAGLIAEAPPARALEPTPPAAVSALQDRGTAPEARRPATTPIPPDQRARLVTTFRHDTTVVAAAVGGAVPLGALAGGAQMAVAAGVAMLAVYLLLP